LTAEFVDDFTKSKGDIRKLWQKALIFIIGKPEEVDSRGEWKVQKQA